MRILHVFRTPVGGLFRHVRDLVRGQTALGHAVGIICDSTTGGASAATLLDALAPQCVLGVNRLPISRLPGIGDLSAASAVARLSRDLKPDILHGHGAKGGLYARLAGRRLRVRSVYTPHGGTLHFAWPSPQGAVYLSMEKVLRRMGTGLLFVCEFERQAFDRKIGLGGKPNAVVYNGLWPEEFSGVVPVESASDVLYIGELRRLKGVDVLLDALGHRNRQRRTTATIVGSGPDRSAFEVQAKDLGLGDSVTFTGAMPARDALPRGRLFVMPSRAESFPYVILETIAAGVPVIASRVGGIPEVLPETLLVQAGDPAVLSAAIGSALDNLAGTRATAARLRDTAQRSFDAARMSAEISRFYQQLPVL